MESHPIASDGDKAPGEGILGVLEVENLAPVFRSHPFGVRSTPIGSARLVVDEVHTSGSGMTFSAYRNQVPLRSAVFITLHLPKDGAEKGTIYGDEGWDEP